MLETHNPLFCLINCFAGAGILSVDFLVFYALLFLLALLFQHLKCRHQGFPLDAIKGHYEDHYKGQGLLMLKGLKGHFRNYDWS